MRLPVRIRSRFRLEVHYRFLEAMMLPMVAGSFIRVDRQGGYAVHTVRTVHTFRSKPAKCDDYAQYRLPFCLISAGLITNMRWGTDKVHDEWIQGHAIVFYDVFLTYPAVHFACYAATVRLLSVYSPAVINLFPRHSDGLIGGSWT
jgi:hypothetical protein